MEEIYKDIPDYEGMYQVSNLGNVKSLERVVKHWRGGLKVVREKVLKGGVSSGRYLSVVLSKECKTHTIRVHNLVAMVFLGHTKKGHDLVVDHIDENSLNNRLDNLQVITQRNNVVRSIDKSKTSSKYVGVSWHKPLNKWRSVIRVKGKHKHIGYFTEELEASKAYQKELLTITKNN